MKRACYDELEGEPMGKRLKTDSPREETKQEEPELNRNIRIMKELLCITKQQPKEVVKKEPREMKSVAKPMLFQPVVVLHNWISAPKPASNGTKSPLQRYLSLDCEFVQCGSRHALARISIVD